MVMWYILLILVGHFHALKTSVMLLVDFLFFKKKCLCPSLFRLGSSGTDKESDNLLDSGLIWWHNVFVNNRRHKFGKRQLSFSYNRLGSWNWSETTEPCSRTLQTHEILMRNI